ncbi:YqgE/AlgH family protein [Epilithonimonas ginsengisoli]|uniref:YqgE/AlgH family protein n=1 Tax=Epilithonimonas ginsengisoli TaxID=1245592 RepID=A0ABU4JCX0_9FLAO|nr:MULTISPECIES: YqgE/AlgH family protein [Chryseobacterium group]MBV6878253.1 YqgE/AlgH family protein [Epilithonimonas sp. FP105]MDW8547506.1 YqgE/AlgH family protein [Epilithonimonas ginsengisoli]OAH68907.1 transcriptional regulator [Chryseobacterium sp. FP211-J200]
MNYSYKGKILISTPDISGDIFSRSVVLIIDHNENGAFGLILNKKNQNMSSKLLNILGFPVELYEGGPVEHGRIYFILKGEKITTEFIEINKEFYLTEDIDSVVSAMINGEISTADIKVFSGYSGWGALQLEGELQRKMWTIVDVYNLDYTLPNDQGLWKNIMQNLGGEFLLWANAPEDVSMN